MSNGQSVTGLKSIAGLVLILATAACQVEGPGAETPTLVAVYANGPGNTAPVVNNEYIIMPSTQMLLDVSIPYPSTLQVEVGPSPDNPFAPPCPGGTLTIPPPPNDPASLAKLRQNPGYYTLQALNNVATDPYVIYRINISAACAFNSVVPTGTGNNGQPVDLIDVGQLAGNLTITDIPVPNHSGASSAPPLYVPYNAPDPYPGTWPPPPASPQPTPATTTVPNLVGLSETQALNEISNAHLQPSIETLAGGFTNNLYVTSQSPVGGKTVDQSTYVTIYLMASMPAQSSGYSSVKVWNCNMDGDAIELYMKEDNGNPTDEGSMAAQYDNGAACPGSTQPGKTITLQSNHNYQLIDVNRALPNCSNADSSDDDCVVYSSQTIPGNSSGSAYSLDLP